MPRTTKRLGRGLDALLPSMPDEEGSGIDIDVDQVRANPYQPRHDFNEEKLRELAQSIAEHGVIQPIVVRRRAEGDYELVAGERRLRAARLAGLESIPAIVGEFTDAQVMELAVVENLQREDLNPIEEAQAYQTLIDEFDLTQEQLATRIGKSRPHISNTLRLLNLPRPVQELVSGGRLSAGHARALLSLAEAELQKQLAETVIARGLSVRETEELTRKGTPKTPSQSRSRQSAGQNSRKDPELLLLEDQLRQTLGAPVRIQTQKDKGTIQIQFFGLDDLTRIFERLVGIEEPL